MRAFVLLSLICALAFAGTKSYDRIVDTSKIGDEAKNLIDETKLAASNSNYHGYLTPKEKHIFLKAIVTITKEIQADIASKAIVKHNALNAKDIAAITDAALVVVNAHDMYGSIDGNKVRVYYTFEGDIAIWVDKINLKNQSDILTKKLAARVGRDAVQNKIEAIEHFNNASKCFLKKDDCDYKNYTENYTAAVEEFTKAVALNPDLKEAYRLRGDIYADLGAYKKAIADYDQALKLDGGYIIAYIKRGDAYYYISEYKKAIADYDRAIELEPDNDATYASRANAYRNIGKYEKALADYNQTLKLNPQYERALKASWLINNCLNEDNIKFTYTNSILIINMKKELNPNNAKSYYDIGEIYHKRGTPDYSQAIAYYVQAIKIDPDYIDAYMQTGSVYSDIGFYDKMIIYYGKALKIDPNNTTAYAERGFAYMQSGDYAKAFADYNQAIKIDRDYDMAYFLRANAYRDLGEYEKALDNYAQSIVLESGNRNRNNRNDPFNLQESRKKYRLNYSFDYRNNLNLALKLIEQEKLIMSRHLAKDRKGSIE
ncbi:MAG: tetratricopeptide repeat protein [Helicobacteraceae bacterium]|jgi:tetratricopeptide (TPR) repeat protein|nr:tetratricopeptide repeat protein [Helicobacteraceae bacterium]